jgi:tetratricopeptide (TPR) repeat protein
LASALDLQRRGLDLARANGDQFTEIDAQIGLAETYWLWAQASEKLGDAEAALSFYDSSIRAADEALRLLGNTTAHRSLAQAYLAQGKARFGLGRIWSAQDRLVSARADLQVALQAFDRCVQEGNEAPYDAILREQIIGQGCQPLREQTQQMVEVTGPS